MTENSRFWEGTSTGDASEAPYTDDLFGEFQDFVRANNRAYAGVFSCNRTGYDGHLQVTNPSGLTIRMATGVGLVDGVLYINDADVDFAGVAGNWYGVVLRKVWSSQTVRAQLIGPYASEANVFSGVNQTDDDTWEVLLYVVQVVGSGDMNIYDKRAFINGPNRKSIFLAPFYAYDYNAAAEIAVTDNADSWGEKGWLVPEGDSPTDISDFNHNFAFPRDIMPGTDLIFNAMLFAPAGVTGDGYAQLNFHGAYWDFDNDDLEALTPATLALDVGWYTLGSADKLYLIGDSPSGGSPYARGNYVWPYSSWKLLYKQDFAGQLIWRHFDQGSLTGSPMYLGMHISYQPLS